MTTTNHLRELAARLRRAGATVPLGENKGTIESAMQHGLSIALVVTEEMAERVEKEDSISSRIQELEERVAFAELARDKAIAEKEAALAQTKEKTKRSGDMVRQLRGENRELRDLLLKAYASLVPPEELESLREAVREGVQEGMMPLHEFREALEKVCHKAVETAKLLKIPPGPGVDPDLLKRYAGVPGWCASCCLDEKGKFAYKDTCSHCKQLLGPAPGYGA